MGISVNDSKLDQLVRLISEWPGLMSRPHRALIDDGLVLLDHLGDARSLVDVGSGAGLPGLPIKIVRPELDVTLIEADQDRAAFLVTTARCLAPPAVAGAWSAADPAAGRRGLRSRSGRPSLAVRSTEATKDGARSLVTPARRSTSTASTLLPAGRRRPVTTRRFGSGSTLRS